MLRRIRASFYLPPKAHVLRKSPRCDSSSRWAVRIVVPEEAAATTAVPLVKSQTNPAPQLPSWYPAWAKELADLFFSGRTCVFVLHGNVHDLIRCPRDDQDVYCS